MEWREEGVLLAARPHGESSAIIEVFTLEHGRHMGVVRGGTSRKKTPDLQPGAQLDLTWRARLDDHIGTFTVEPLKNRAALILSDRLALLGLNAITALLSFSLPEREAHGRLYDHTLSLLGMLTSSPLWPIAYLRWEMALLEDLGFGLDLSRCAVTGTVDNLVYVSPKSGRAVSRDAAGDWADRMLPLSGLMVGSQKADEQSLMDGLTTTGYFLSHWLAHSLGDKPLPASRQRLIDRLQSYSFSS